jgi:hypothetical protein
MTASGFEPIPEPRFRIINEGVTQRIVIPATRNWFILLFIPVWLTFWTIAGIAAVAGVISGQDRGFLIIWLVFWVIGWLFAASWLGWNVSGKETLAIEGNALIRGWRLLGFGRQKRYDLARVTDIATGTPPFPYSVMKVSYPPFFPMTFGPLKWNYGASTIYAAGGLSEAEAGLIANILRSKLPARMR